MEAVALTLALFAGWTLVGLGLLAIREPALRSMRLSLAAPIIGACTTTILTYLLSVAGVTVGESAVPVTVVLLVAATVLLAWRRVRPAWPVLAVFGIAALALGVMAAPMWDLGFGWMANGNLDMANYAMQALRLIQRPINAAFDLSGLLQGTDLIEAAKAPHAAGARPGGELTMALASEVSGRTVLEVTMPTTVALQMATTSAVASLARSASARPWVPPLAAAIFLLMPMVTYGVEQQLISQVFGLGILAALGGVLMSADTYTRPRAFIAPAAVLAAGLGLVYTELVGVLGLGYVVFAAIVLLRRRVAWRQLARFVVPTAALGLLLLAPYVPRGVEFFRAQLAAGLEPPHGVSLFSYITTPNALPGMAGIKVLIPPPGGTDLAPWIVVGIGLLLLVVALALISARRGEAAGAVLTAMLVTAVLLALRDGNFGLFKLTMYVLPFVAATAAAAVGRRWWLGLGLLALVPFWWSTLQDYVDQSRRSADVPGASSADVLPQMRALRRDPRSPVVSALDNLVLERWMTVEDHGLPVSFLARDPSESLLNGFDAAMPASARKQFDRYVSESPWRKATLPLRQPTGTEAIHFAQDTLGIRRLAEPGCRLVLPGPATTVVNRKTAFDPRDYMQVMPCAAARDQLVFVSSREGAHYYLGEKGEEGRGSNISFYQLEGDPSNLSSSFSAAGRYSLYQLLGPTEGVRLRIDLTSSYQPQGRTQLPPAAVVGAQRQSLRLVGQGSARVTSPPLHPFRVGSASYVALDLGRAPDSLSVPRSGLANLWAKKALLDPRFGVVRMRSVSLIGEAAYSAATPPDSVTLPKGLADPRLEYSGIGEDGWVGKESRLVLTAARGSFFTVKGLLPKETTPAGCRLTVTDPARTVLDRYLQAGEFTVTSNEPETGPPGRRDLLLRFSCAGRLSKADVRTLSANLTYAGFTGGTA